MRNSLLSEHETAKEAFEHNFNRLNTTYMTNEHILQDLEQSVRICCEQLGFLIAPGTYEGPPSEDIPSVDHNFMSYASDADDHIGNSHICNATHTLQQDPDWQAVTYLKVNFKQKKHT